VTGQAWSKKLRFAVDVAGVIEIMGMSLYSQPFAAVRELIQNAHDAIQRRRELDLEYSGRIDILLNPQEGTVTFQDDGIGLNAEEAERYLGTLGVGMTGVLRKEATLGTGTGAGQSLIGMFGVGLFSAFMLADRVRVESKRHDGAEPVSWDAGAGEEITLASCDRDSTGTSVKLFLRESFKGIARSPEAMEEAVKAYADHLPIPIHINGSGARVNLVHSNWLAPTVDEDALSQDIQDAFNERPLEIIPVRSARPAVSGVLYVTPQRTPAFSGLPLVTVTVRRMVISRRIDGLIPEWAPFLRGVLELPECGPTSSREDLVCNRAFDSARGVVEEEVFKFLELLADKDMGRLTRTVLWHRYTLAGAALGCPRLRTLLSRCYPFDTSHGSMVFGEVRRRSVADALVESELDEVIWFNSDRRQEQSSSALFAGRDAPCVQTTRSFEEPLLLMMAADAGPQVGVRVANLKSLGFARSVLGIGEVTDAPSAWTEFLAIPKLTVHVAGFDPNVPAMTLLDERNELDQTVGELLKTGHVPEGFKQIMTRHMDTRRQGSNQVLLNRRHKLIARALGCKPSHPLGSVLRLLVYQSLEGAGLTLPSTAHRSRAEDLEWISEALGGRVDG
jgi:molecular chaperone HtpG